MKKIIILFSLLIIGCNQPFKKSVVESLSAKELNSLYKQDDRFKSIYKYIEKTREEHLKTESSKAEFIDLNYDRFTSFADFVSDTIFFDEVYAKSSTEWNSRYGSLSKKIDSTIENSAGNLSEKSILRYLEYEEDHKDDKIYIHFGENPYKKDVSKSVLGMDYIDRNSFISNKKDSIYKARYPKCYDFKQLNSFDFNMLRIELAY